MSERELEEEQWRQKLERLSQIQERIREITDHARSLRLHVTEPVRAKARERVGQFLDRLDRVAPPTSQAVKCPSCGAEIPKEAKFCPECGVGLPPPVRTPETPAVEPPRRPPAAPVTTDTRKYVLA